MPNIQNILTKEEKIFIKSQGLDISDFFDARGLGGYRKYHDIVKAAGCHFVISNFCSKGHRLKDRHGHCIMCRPIYIAMLKRFSKSGLLYIAVSGDVCKVGITENNFSNPSDSIYRRQITLNMDDGYGSLKGWKIVKYWEVNNAARIENDVHQLLAKYKMEGVDYWYSGEWHVADELFRCSARTASNIVKKVLESK